MTEQTKTLIPSVALVATLAISPVAPEAGNVIFLVCGLLALACMWPVAIRHLGRAIVWMPLTGIVLLGVAYFASAGAAGAQGLLYFAPLLAITPLTALLDESDQKGHARQLAIFALSGVAGAAVMAVNEVAATGTTRAGGMIANPIHFADVVLLVGFIALAGLAAIQSRWRYVLLVAPFISLLSIVLSGTRGTLIAYIVMCAVAAGATFVMRLIPRRMVLLGVFGLIFAAGLAVALGAGQLPGMQRMIVDLTNLITSGNITDTSSNLRLQMYLGGLRAFLASPIFGQGPLAFTAVADSLADTSFGGAPHLHNDLIDMGASAGIFGLAAYFLITLAPLVEAIHGYRCGASPWVLVLSLTLVAGFFVMGLTNAMFGILNITTVFAAMCVAVAGLSRRS